MRIHDDDGGTDHTLRIWPQGSFVVDEERVAIGSDVFYESGSIRVAEAGILDLRMGFVGARNINLEGRLNAYDGGSQISANVTFQSDSQTDIGEDAELELIGDGYIVAGAAFSGTGKLFNSTGSTLVVDNAADIGVTVLNSGNIELGDSIGNVAVTNGNYEQRSSGTLALDIQGTDLSQFDSLHITGGSAILDGTLVMLVPEAGPVLPGDEFEVMTFDSHLGDFNNVITAAPQSPGLWFEHEYRAGDTNLTLVATSLAADFNLDGSVNDADLDIWKQNFGTACGTTFLQGDNDSDGDIDGMDFLAWQRNHGSSLPASGSFHNTAVPEPASLLLLVVVALGGLTHLRLECHSKNAY